MSDEVKPDVVALNMFEIEGRTANGVICPLKECFTPV
jgi:hypothetical protein